MRLRASFLGSLCLAASAAALLGCAPLAEQNASGASPGPLPTADAGAIAPAPGPAGVGARLPEVPLRTLDDQSQGLGQALGGKPALVSFWATWCESCAAEFDALNRLDARAKASGALVVGVAVGETRQKASELIRARRLSYLNLVDEEFKLADALGQRKIPATIVVDRKGRVVFVGGAIDEQALAAFRAVLGS